MILLKILFINNNNLLNNLNDNIRCEIYIYIQ